MIQIKIELSDDISQEVEKGLSVLEAIKQIDKKLSKKAIAVKINDKLIDLTSILEEDTKLEIITFDDIEGQEIYNHTTSHIMAQAVQELFNEVKLGIGPSIENGFYYDFDYNGSFTPDDLEKIEKKMKEIIKLNLPFKRTEISKQEAIKIFSKRDEKYKLELIAELEEDAIISYYQQGDFIDLCRGPHLPSTGYIKSFKLLSIAGAYWRGDEKQAMLQRIYATSFPDKKLLKEYLNRLKEAAKRDHRKLGIQLDLYSIHEEGGPGLIYWHPKGTVLREVISDFWKKAHKERNYEFVTIPHIARAELWKTSGHYDFYKENMFILQLDRHEESQEYVLKPMNCPGHILIYKTKKHSYRDLPLRYAELGTVYRYERSGTLHGMLRVRGFTQDDAHIFCTYEQLPEEILGVLDLTVYMLKCFGFDDYQIELSVRDPKQPEKYAGADEDWIKAEESLVSALNERNLSYKRMEGEAVFYGPKIDIKLLDALGRSWQASTIQFDFNLPSRFGVNYVGSDGKEHNVVMVHRAILGALERFIGTLIEHYAGSFPLWLSPVQLVVMTITEKQNDYAEEVLKQLKDIGFRVESDFRNEKIGYKIREATSQKIPYLLIIGEREKENKTVSIRKRGVGEQGNIALSDLIKQLENEIKEFH